MESQISSFQAPAAVDGHVTRKPFTAPTVTAMGEMRTLTQLQGVTIIPP